MDLELKTAIKAYTILSTELERTRRSIVNELTGVMTDRIIPEVEQYLPDRYSINLEDSKIETRGESADDLGNEIDSCSVPIDFYANLRLIFDGDQIGWNDSATKQLGRIQNKLKPRLEKIAENYGIKKIEVMPEEILMG